MNCDFREYELCTNFRRDLLQITYGNCHKYRTQHKVSNLNDVVSTLHEFVDGQLGLNE